MRYKRAALEDNLGKITGTSAGTLAGGLSGYGLASMFSDNKSIRILAALAGAVAGGYGGYRLGDHMDTLRAVLIGTNEDLTRLNIYLWSNLDTQRRLRLAAYKMVLNQLRILMDIIRNIYDTTTYK